MMMIIIRLQDDQTKLISKVLNGTLYARISELFDCDLWEKKPRTDILEYLYKTDRIYNLYNRCCTINEAFRLFR